MKFLVLLILLIGAVFLYSSVTQTKDAKSNTTEVAEYSASWLTDLSVVLAKAKEEGKPILMNFTESKLCGWCIKLKKEVFSKPVFIDYANEHLILMIIDFSSEVQQEESLIDQNYQLLDAFGIYQFPTIILVDTEGNIIGRTGYLRGGPKAYVDHLKDMLAKEIQ